ncbi:MAG: hypothetical protein RMM58_13010 [Chloroflexota bacterium]|nr:hypothetical protein [Dehalococcoidia bacterium]MDW8254790.1 hypothetical protein [Chloroflexota bacterium]
MNETSALPHFRVSDQLRMLATIAEQVDRLEVENRSLIEERERLRGALAEAELRIGQLRDERDRLARELETARQDMQSLRERETAWQSEAGRIAHALRELAEREVAALRELADQLVSTTEPPLAPAPAAAAERLEPAAQATAGETAQAVSVGEAAAPAEAPAPPVDAAAEAASSAVEPSPVDAAVAEKEAAAAEEPAATVPAPPPAAETYELTASPFSSFSTLIAFQKAVAGLPGVEDVRTKSFLNGALVLSLRYSGADPLTASLARLPGFRAERLSAVGNRIEFVVAPDSAQR